MTHLARSIALSACLFLAIVHSAAAQGGKYHEAPTVAEQVKAGKLPPVEQRLPEQPLVVPVVEKVGEYGGVWRRAFLGPADANNYVRVVYDGLFRFTPDGAEIEPKIAAGAKSSADFKVWTILLRKGARWSDGAPFTADDIVFWYKDVLLNKDLMPSLPSWIRNADGTAANVEKVDDYTVRFTYDRPATLFLTEVANQDGADGGYAMFLPAHYLKKFHPAYTAKEEVDRLAQSVSFKTWTELFLSRATLSQNPERPTMAAWMPMSRVSDPVFTLRRNPYYIGVDTAGNQLPYIDEVRFTYFADQQALNLAAIAGNFDMQARHIQMTNYPVLKEQEKNGKYRVLTWPTFGGADAVVNFNMTYKADPEIGKLINTKDFRVALSIAINRDEIKELVFLGLGEARQGVPAPWHPYFPGKEWATKHTEFNRDEANKMLDALGLTKRDAQGIRLMANGKPATIELSVVPAFGAWPDVAQLIARGLGGGRHQDGGADPRARAALQDERGERADGLDLERGHHGVSVHGQRQVRSAQYADADAGAALHALAAVGRQGRRGADRADQADHAACRYGANRRARRSGAGGAGAVPHLGGQRVRDRHSRA